MLDRKRAKVATYQIHPYFMILFMHNMFWKLHIQKISNIITPILLKWRNTTAVTKYIPHDRQEKKGKRQDENWRKKTVNSRKQETQSKYIKTGTKRFLLFYFYGTFWILLQLCILLYPCTKGEKELVPPAVLLLVVEKEWHKQVVSSHKIVHKK